jgi:hypothetical protein
VDLLALETVGDDADKYMSKIPSFNPGMDFFFSRNYVTCPTLEDYVPTFFGCSFLKLKEEADARL